MLIERCASLISIETDNSDEVRHAVNLGLFTYNDQFAGPMENAVLTIAARDVDKKIIGGLVANLQPGWKWMHLHRLWVVESHRRVGIGRQLVETAEKHGRKRGCLYVAVDTFEFQARPFYEKQGYVVYAVREDYPVGHRQFMMRKTLLKANPRL
jgi:ribosomal protein S18 acetylase RimI-like enzyme